LDQRKISKDTLVMLPAKVLEGVIGIATLSYITFSLSTDAVDVFTTVNTFMQFAYLLLTGWLANSLGRYVGDSLQDPQRRAGFFTTSSVLWLAINLAAFAVSGILWAAAGLWQAMAVCVMFSCYSVYQITLSMLVLSGKRDASVILSLLAAVLKPVVIWLACTAAQSLPISSAIPAIAAYAVSELVSGGIAVFLLKIPKNFCLRSYSPELRRIFLHYGVPLMGVSLSVGLLNFADRFVLIFFDTNFEVYSVNVSISSAVFTMLMVGIMRAVYPSVLRGYREDGYRGAQPMINSGVRIYLMIALPAAAGLAAVGHDLSAALYPASYTDGAVVIGIYAFAMFFTGLTEYAIKAWELRGDTQPIMQNALLAVALKLILSVVLLPVLGIAGAAVGSLIAFAVYFSVSALRARKTFLFRVRLITWLRIGAGSAACFGAARLCCDWIASPALSLVSGIPAGMAAYALVLIVTGEVRQELQSILRLLRRK